MRFQAFFVIFLAVLLSACSAKLNPYERGLTTEQIEIRAQARFEDHHRERDFVQGVLGSVRAQDRETLIRFLAPSLVSPTIQRDFDSFFSNFPNRAPQTIDMVGYQTNLEQQTGRADRLTLQVEYVFNYEGYGPVYLTMTGVADGAASLRAINLNSSLLDAAQWQPQSQLGTTRQLVRVLAIASPLILLIALAVWVSRARQLRRRLIWLVVILATSPTFAFNWASRDFNILAPTLESIDGVWHFDLVQWVPFGLQLAKSGDYAPWIITIGLPLGALWFLIKLASGRIELRTTPLALPAANADETTD